MDEVEEEDAEMGEALQKEKALAEPIYVNTLQSFETVGYFDADTKRRFPTREKPSKLVKLGKGRTLKIVATQEFGYPNSHDLDFKRALFRLIDESAEVVERINADGTKTFHRRPPQQPIRVKSKTIIRYAGRSPNKRERKLLTDFLNRNKSTSMIGDIENPKTREFGERNVSLFSEIVTKGQITKNGREAEEHLIWLSPHTMRLYFWNRTRKEDISFHNSLSKPISKVLYPYLDSGWFASYTKGGGGYTKSYPSTCQWLSLRQYKAPSDIKRQLDPAHLELQARGYLASWSYRKGAEGDWLITWLAGEKWQTDMKARGHKTVRTFLPPPKPKKEATPQPDKKDDCLFCNDTGHAEFTRVDAGTAFMIPCNHSQDFITAVEQQEGAKFIQT